MADGLAGDIAPERLIGERIAGRFMVERLIGRGELSTAFRAHDERLHRRVTVKVFHPRHRDDVHVVESQLAAARSVARLSHENIAIVIDRGEHEGLPVVVLEHVRGENFQERIDRFAPLPVAEVVNLALQIARALAYAHGHGVVHGNLRPGNVLLTEDRDAKIVDFGGGSYVAQLVGDPYSAPELREVDPGMPAEPSDDIYALGALCWVALTEQAPRAGADQSELQVLRPDVSPRLAGTIARALSLDPEARHLSMRELAAELAAVREASLAAPDRDAARSDMDQPTQAWALDHVPADEQATGIIAMPRQGAGSGDDASAATSVTGRPVRRRRAPREKRARTPQEVRARILAWSIVVAPLAALVIFGLMIAGERSSDQVESGTKQRGNAVTKVAVVGASSFDPRPGGDGSEHEDEVAGAYDDNPETSWQTEGYATIFFNQNVKPGVGLMLQLESPKDVREIRITTDLPGWVVDVRAAETPATTLAGWRPVSEAVAVKSGAAIPVDMGDTEASYLLLWITQLAIDTDDTNKARARIEQVDVFAADSQ